MYNLKSQTPSMVASQHRCDDDSMSPSPLSGCVLFRTRGPGRVYSVREAHEAFSCSMTDFMLCLLSFRAHVSLHISTQCAVERNENDRHPTDQRLLVVQVGVRGPSWRLNGRSGDESPSKPIQRLLRRENARVL